MVSVICMCYNHEKYIKDALEGFVNQKTTFKYEVFVHDDASTDKSADIIREYEKKYPEIIKPIYQTQNQYSQGIKIAKTYILPNISGKYIASCEGDDYWTSENKLQKQVDFLESHPEFSVCVHNTEYEFMLEGRTEIKYPLEDREIEFENDMGQNCGYHTSSVLIRRDFYLKKPSWVFMVPGVGDLPSAIYYMLSGRVMYFGDVMSHYRCGVAGSWTDRYISNLKKQIKDNKNIIKMLKAANKYYDYKFSEFFSKRIEIYRNIVLKCCLRYYFPFLVKIKRAISKRGI